MNIDSTWVPIHQQTTTKCLSRVGTMKAVKRKQFPLISACAITIHKSQGGTFDEVVYAYDRQHEQSLVYVALSRVTNLRGLYLISYKNDFNFYHGRKMSKRTQPIRDEFNRLGDNRLVTIQDMMLEKLDLSAENNVTLTIFNCQSLKRNHVNLNDPVIQKTDFLLLSETWLNNEEQVPTIQNFSIATRFKNSFPLQRGGGVAIYLRNTLSNNIQATSVSNCENFDLCCINYVFNEKPLCIVNVYCRPHFSVGNIISCLEKNLNIYSLDIPLIVAGDFNVNFGAEGKSVIDWLEENFRLKYFNDQNVPVSTTINGTPIDAIFHRLVNIEFFSYMSNFSYHKPIICTVNI